MPRIGPTGRLRFEGLRQTGTGKAGTLRRLIRFFQRLAVFGLGIFAVWFNVFVVFRITDQRLPWIVALALTYGIAAYVILPRIVRMSLKILQRKSVPSFTLTGDGFPGDPVNLALVGTLAQLRAAFAGAEWTEADPLGLKSSWGMVVAFVLNRPYPAAPFSTLYLFGAVRTSVSTQSRFFISTCRGRWRSRRAPEFLGCGSSGKGWGRAFISGRSTGGCSYRPVRHRRGLPPHVERELRARGPHRRPARRLPRRQMAFHCCTDQCPGGGQGAPIQAGP